MSFETDSNAPTFRKQVLVDAIRSTIRTVGGYPYVMETPVLYPGKDRTFYSLVYATRNPVGVEVFRDCQAKTLAAQDSVRSAMKGQKRANESGMDDLLAGIDTGDFYAPAWIAEQECLARDALIRLAPQDGSEMSYKALWSAVLSEFGIKKTRLGKIAASLKASGDLDFPDWEQNRRVPQDNYKVMGRQT